MEQGLKAEQNDRWYLLDSSRRPSGLRKTIFIFNSLAHRTTWLRSDFILNFLKGITDGTGFEG